MISDVDIRDWRKPEQEVGRGIPACGWLWPAAPFLLAVSAPAIATPAAGKDQTGTVALPSVSLREETVEVVEEDSVER